MAIAILAPPERGNNPHAKFRRSIWACAFSWRDPAYRCACEERLPIDDPASIHLQREVERWYFELHDPLFRFLRTMRCRRAVAEDITQETFLRLNRALLEGAEIHDVRAWLFRVARNLYIDSQREDQRYDVTTGDVRELIRPDPVPDPEQRLLRLERSRWIAREVLRLSVLQRECLRLKAQGLQYNEIAALLGITMTTAVDHVRYAVKRLGRRFVE